MDAKYYKDALLEHYGTKRAHSGNLYQLLAYLRAEAAGAVESSWGVPRFLGRRRHDGSLGVVGPHLPDGGVVRGIGHAKARHV